MDSESKIDNKNKKQIEIVLKTSLPEDYSIANNSMAVPTNFDTNNLDKLVKKMISVNDTKDFVFYIEDKFLDTNIQIFLQNNPELLKLSEEKPLDVQYTHKVDEPKLANTIKEDEWIRKIAIRKVQNFNNNKLEYYCVGLFNSEISLYNPQFEKVLTIDEVKDKDNCCDLLHDILFYQSEASESLLIKCSRNEDENIKIFSIDTGKMTYSQIYSVSKKDTEYINCLALNPISFNFFCAGGTDGNINIFKLNDASERKTTKKRKIEYQNLNPHSSLENCHTEVKDLVWLNNQQLLSSGDDFSVKLWNISTKTNYSSYNMNYKLCTSLVNIATTETFLTGQEDGRIKLWDIKQNKPTVTFTGHSYCVADIAILPGSVNNFLSVGYDGHVKLWDTRSNKKCLYDIKTGSEKNYTIEFNTRDYFLTGGDNSTVNIYNLP
jgi:WD40 repeat protein